jgi:two-component system osmolarity sensor histidine kinase EnvZ
MAISIRSVLPRGLYGRAALILALPLVLIQLIVSINFVQRHYESVARQMTRVLVQELRHVADAGAEGMEAVAARAEPLAIAILPAEDAAATDRRGAFDFSGRVVIEELHGGLPETVAVDLEGVPRKVRVTLDLAGVPVVAEVSRARVSASNPHQLLVLMMFAGLVLMAVAGLFMRNQLRPILRLAAAAEAFGKGRVEPYRPRGATEVRAAGAAFLEMRDRIERQIEQRTLMLSGVSHDLRTPLTRLKLGIAMLDQSPEVEALGRDVIEMERMLDAFLAFARDDATEPRLDADPADIVRRVVENARRAGHLVAFETPTEPLSVALRASAVSRALGNLVENAARHGTQVAVTLAPAADGIVIAVEDDGPGIDADRQDEAMRPFTRLESSREQNSGGHVGLGLAIAADVARNHGGMLALGRSARLGGLRAELRLPR